MILCLLCAVEICSKEAGHCSHGSWSTGGGLYASMLYGWHTAAGQDRTNTEGEDR